MKRITDHIRERLLARVIDSEVGDKAESLESLQRSEWSPLFEKLMRVRLLMGRFRYGRMNRIGDKNYDRVASAKHRLQMYRETGNTEYLVDVANLCMLEFEHGTHPNKHFNAIDDGHHVART